MENLTITLTALSCKEVQVSTDNGVKIRYKTTVSMPDGDTAKIYTDKFYDLAEPVVLSPYVARDGVIKLRVKV